MQELDEQRTRSYMARRRRAYVSIWGTTQMHLRNPLVIAFWSAMFPGLGHLLLSKYIRGCLLFIWEVIINLEGHVNLAILYTFIGKFDIAAQVLNVRWMMLYIPTYLFSIWDSYRTATDINNHFLLAAREDAEVQPFVLHPLGLNYMDKGSPWVAAVWSMLSPGTGQLILHRIIVAFFLLIWWIIIVYMSKLLPAIHFTMLGQFREAKEALDMQWFMNVPSLYFFSIYDAYANSVESNKLFEWEQGKFLRREYQDRLFRMPLARIGKGQGMYLVASFEHTICLEKAISAMEMKGVAKRDILAVPLDRRNDSRMLFDTTHTSDRVSMLDAPILIGAFLTLLGSIYGFVLQWGPVLWGLIGMALGTGVGIVIKLFTTRKAIRKKQAGTPEVFLLIACREELLEPVREILWANAALGVAKLSMD